MKRRRYQRKPFHPISPDKFRQVRQLVGLTQKEASCLLHVTPRTLALWESGKTRIPYAAFKLLKILVGYDLPGEAWQGWSIRGDTLWSPEGRPYRAGYLSYQWLTFSMADSWRRSLREAADHPGAAALAVCPRVADADLASPRLRLVG